MFIIILICDAICLGYTVIGTMGAESKSIIKTLAVRFKEREWPRESPAVQVESNELSVQEEIAQLRSRVISLQDENEEYVEQVAQLQRTNEDELLKHSEEIENQRRRHQNGFEEMQRELTESNKALQVELENSQEREAQLKLLFQKDCEQQSGKENVRFENQIKRLKNEKEEMLSRLEDHSRLKKTNEQMRIKFEEMKEQIRAFKERLEIVDESNAKVSSYPPLYTLLLLHHCVSSFQRLDRILELEGLEKDREFNKNKVGELNSTVCVCLYYLFIVLLNQLLLSNFHRLRILR